ncbi:uncharacterized protein BDV17DRAFT_289057 [Aspergillus undulatus]|uniref:uncharacterized protein n=1 Tax=Aspergillus undulatus TaxID=1810928 RepID=UPI003CCD7C07
MYFASHSKIAFILVAALTIACAASIRHLFIRRQFARLHGCQPVARHSNKDPFLGLARDNPRSQRAQNARKEPSTLPGIRNTFGIKQLQRSAILTIEPENIKTILSRKFKDYGISFRLAPFKPLPGEGIFDTYGDHWASSRAVLRPSFTRDQVADLTTLEDLIQDLFAILPRDGTTIVDQELFFGYTIDFATEFLFGQSVYTLKQNQS